MTGVAIGNTAINGSSEGQIGQAAISVLAPTSFGSGQKRIGIDIAAGLYRSNNSPTASCYWERLSGFGGTLAEILANDIGPGPAVVAVAVSDVAFGSSGCATWAIVTGPITTSQTASFGSGTFVVGMDVAAGIWRSSAVTSSCYWERKSGFSGTLAQIIANDFGSSPVNVTIMATDAGFQSSGCGSWTRQ